jgi:hypothetical protein
MPPVSELTINFSANGNSLSYLGGGWARAEEGFTWATGLESHLLVPFGAEPREFVLTMNVVPFVLPPALSRQRLTVSVDETIIGTASLTRPTALAWRIPTGLVRRSERTLITLSHPDVARPRDLGAGADDRELTFSVSEVRVYHMPAAMAGQDPIPPGLSLGATVRPGFAIHPNIELAAWVTRRTGMSLPELAASFESIGDNCEFGLVQRKCDTEPLGLLRFSGSYSNDIVRGIERDFEGIGEPADIEPRLEGGDGRREFMIHERKYGLVYHTFVYEGERTPELMLQQEATRLKFLRRKFVEELDAGHKIFVFRRGARAAEAEILPIYMALNCRQANTLLWVVPEEPGRPSGTVEVLMNGLLKGYIDRFAPNDNAYDFSFNEWVKLCVNAWLLNRMIRARA